MQLEGKKALVTGGSRGIGAAIVHAFLEEGAHVFYIARSPGDGLADHEQAAKAAGGSVAFKQCDISDQAELEKVIADILAESGGLDVLVNNAGITRDALVFRMSNKDWNDVLQTNLTSAFITCKACANHMIRKRSGSIINVSSITGIIGNGGQCNYAASKAGLIGFSKSLAREVATRNVRVNVIAPGYIETALTDRLGEKQKEAALALIPMGRVGTPQEVAKAAVFLATDQSTYITGQVIQIDGGLAM
ncbi:MAG TPA: 3-oxoacyl-[acyl-carrier-protein] reductase [Spirochaetia bacterium]|nr:3-oxoacyl-[acyl-carrier-protein] reductase [Spirochaetia bacterium]